MSLRDAVKAETRHIGPRCTVAVILDSLKGKARTELEDFLASDIAHSVLARAMSREYDRKVSDQALSRHRGGGCSCGAG